jgi:hypothetical protein
MQHPLLEWLRRHGPCLHGSQCGWCSPLNTCLFLMCTLPWCRSAMGPCTGRVMQELQPALLKRLGTHITSTRAM